MSFDPRHRPDHSVYPGPLTLAGICWIVILILAWSLGAR